MSLFAPRMKLTEAVKFCQRFGTGLRSGVDVLRLLEIEARQGPPPQQRAMRRLIAELKNGEEVGAAMSKDIFFPPTLSSLMVAGDESGKVDRALTLLATHFESRLTTRRQFFASITLPLLQLFAAIMIIALLIYLMGILTPAGGGEMADVLGLGLRGGSGALIWLGINAAVIAAIAAMVFLYLRNFAGIQNIAPLIYALPKIGPAIQTITLAKFCTAMALAFESGLDAIRSVRLGLNATGSDYYRSSGDSVQTAIRGGGDLADAMQTAGVFPRDLIDQVSIAEESGTAAESLNRLAGEYDHRAKVAIRVIAGFVSFLIWASVIIFILFFIFRLFSFYMGALNDAMQPI